MAAPGSVITVFVTNLSKVRESLTIDPEMKVKELKELMRQKMDVPAQFRLGYRSKTLGLKRTLTCEGIPNAAEIWVSALNAPTIQLSGYDQALGRVNRGVQQRGSIKHAIHAVGTTIRTVGTELQSTMNTRADGITNQIETGTKDIVDKIDARTDGLEEEIASSRTVVDATQAQVDVIHNILQGGETIRAPGQTTLERTKQVKIQKTALENERMSLAKEKADEKHVTMEARAKEQDARNKARIDDTAIAADAAQTMFRDVTSPAELEKYKKSMLKACAAQKKRMLEAEEGPPAPKKPRKNSKAAKKQAALDAVAEAATDQSVAESVDTDQPHAAASASHEGDDTR